MTSVIPEMRLEHPGGESPVFLIRLARLFNEGVMGFLALVALATALGPMVFDVSPDIERVLTVVEWVLVGTFAADFFIQGAVATDRRAWIWSRWRIVDALTVLGPIAALLPQVSDLARGSLMLRMLRVGRAVAFGTRAGSVAVRGPKDTGQTVGATTPTVSVISAEGDLRPVESDWDSFLVWASEPGASWFHASNVDHRRFVDLAATAGVSDQEIHHVLDGDGHAKLREGARHTTLVLQIPTVPESGFRVHRHRLLAVITDRGILTAMTGSFELQKSVALQRPALTNSSFPSMILCALLSLAHERNLSIAQRFVAEGFRLENEEGRNFLHETFLLRREISTTALDLWHVKAVIRALADGKTKLCGLDLKDETSLRNLMAATDSLYETVNKNKEEIMALIEVYTNFKSFEMNKLLKLLAVVSCLGLIPSIVGGLLGMNVAGNPWSVTLGQVAFGVAMGMATALYVFAVKGWLR